jgi:hypothetical protein
LEHLKQLAQITISERICWRKEYDVRLTSNLGESSSAIGSITPLTDFVIPNYR